MKNIGYAFCLIFAVASTLSPCGCFAGDINSPPMPAEQPPVVLRKRLAAAAPATPTSPTAPNAPPISPIAPPASPTSAIPLSEKDPSTAHQLTPGARQLAEQLKILELIESLPIKVQQYERTHDTQSLVEILMVRQKLSLTMQYAALEVEEAISGIDGDLALANMLLAYVSTRRDRALLMNNVATFVGSGSLGVLDSSTSLKLGVPTPQIFGIIGNSIATGLPLLALRSPKYASPRRAESSENMLAPIFGRPYPGHTYDRVVWTYIESVPADANTTLTRRQLLLQRWRDYRGVGTTTGAVPKSYIDALVGAGPQNAKLTQELLKTRSELLVDVRALVQLMYKDISDLNTAILEMYHL